MPEADQPVSSLPPSTTPLPPNTASGWDERTLEPFSAHRPRSRVWLVVLTLLLLTAVVIMQRPEPPDPAAATRDKLAATVTPPDSSPYILLGKMLIAFGDAVPGMGEMVQAQSEQSGGLGSTSSADQLRTIMLRVGTNSIKPTPGGGGAAMFPGLTPPPKTPAQMLDEIGQNIAPESPLSGDIALLRPLVEAAEKPDASEQSIRAAVDALPAEARDGLKQRHGWFADVLFSAGDPNSPVRVAAAAQGGIFGILVLVLGLTVMLAIVTGLVLLILGIVWKAGGQIRWSFAPPQRAVQAGADPIGDPRFAWSRGLWLETFAVFLAGFLGIRLVSEALHAALPKQAGLIWFTLLGQWSLLACIFWPVARGLSWREWREQIGWRTPQGPGTAWREVGAGIATYLAGLPIYFFMAIVVVILMMITEAVKKAMGLPPDGLPSNRVTEILGGGGPAVVATVVLLATVWAPIVEESIFRGALYRSLRGPFRVLGAGFFSASAFAIMHGYVAVQLLLVFTLGAIFAVMREWRNSLIPSVTAHFLHNATAMSVMLVAAQFMKA